MLDSRASSNRLPRPRKEASLAEIVEQISAAARIEHVVTRYPATVSVFLRWRMHCVGCPIARFETIADACRIYRRPADRLVAELQAAAADRNGGRERPTREHPNP
jgi:hybrid cluster-associated redox disulfide protein